MWEIHSLFLPVLSILVYFTPFSLSIACSLASALGMEDGRISDWSITASASFKQYVPNNSRLHSNSSWVSSNINQFLQISFQPNFKLITGVATQGDPQHGWWVTRYQLKYSEDAIDWHWYGYGRSHRLVRKCT